MNRHSWTGPELRYLVEKYPEHNARVIAEFLNLTLPSVYSMACDLGLKKSKEFLESDKSGRLNKKLAEVGKPYRFPKGHIPANKGKKTPEHIKEKSKATWFKKGQLPPNTKFDGHISIRIDSKGRPYAHIRVAQGKYELLHRNLWEKHHGPVPVGKIVAFINGDPSDIKIENLELITREENMLRNTRHNYPKDYKMLL
jgi:hypothetical protein